MIGWGVAILPYVEQNAVYQQYNLAALNFDPSNRPVLGTHLNVQVCPSDINTSPKTR